MKPKLSHKLSFRDKAQTPGTLTTKTLKPGKFGRHMSVASFGTTETHRVKVIKLTRTDRAVLESMATRHRVNNLTHFLEGILAAQDRKGNEQILFRIYED
jgi:hypothetical protein